MTTLPSHDRPAAASYGAASGFSLDHPSLSLSSMTGDGRGTGPSLSAVPDLAPTLAPEANTAYPLADELAAQAARERDYPRVSGQPASERRAIVVARASAAVEVLVGVWLALSPWVVGSGGSHVLRWNDVVVGAVLALLAVARLVRPALPRTPSASFGLGAWTIVAAFVLSFQNGATGTAPLWNAICCGAALTAAAAWSTTESERATLRRG